MLPRADLLTVTPVGHADAVTRTAALGDARQEAFQRSLAGLLGQSLKGEVLSKLTDGTFLVKVAGASARLNLPPGTDVGHEVPLTLVSLSPRPTFEIHVAGQAGRTATLAYAEAGPALLPGPEGAAARAEPLVYLEGSHSAPLPAQLPPATPALAPPSADEMPAHAQAAPAAAAAEEPAGAAPAAARSPGTPISHAAALLGKAPLVPASQLPDIDPKSTPSTISDTARVIASVLTTAGPADKVPAAIVGKTPLLKSPDTPPEKLAAVLKDAIGRSGLFYESHVAEWSKGTRALSDLVLEPQMQKALNASAPEAARAQQAASDPATAQFINQQLLTHEQARVSWQGQAWPGQPMQWDIARDAPEGGKQQGDEGPPTWRSGVRFAFPLLGDVSAQVVLVGEHLHIQVQGASEGAAELMRAHAGALGAALDAAGIALASLAIRSGEAGDG